MQIDTPRVVAIGVGIVAASLSAYGAYEMQHGIEGGITYLTIAAPFAVATSAIIPPLAETTWRQRSYVKAIVWWLVLVPTIALAFLSARERVTLAKAGPEAERLALHGAVERAEKDLGEAKQRVSAAEADEKAARDLKKCKEDCRAKWEAATDAARKREAAADKALTRAQSKALPATETVPAWLLPACLDLIAFMAIWTGFAPRRREKVVEAKKAKRRVKRKAIEPRKRPIETPKRVANDNVYLFPAA